MYRQFFACSFSCLLLSLLLVGCGPATRQSVKTVKVSGAVKLGGKPLSDAEVNFVGKDFAGVTKSDAQGNYSLDAQPGSNVVYFSKFDGAVDPTMSQGDSGQGGPKQLIPKKFASATESKLTHTVAEKDATGVDFDLK
jgi:hypothetical protein